MEGVCRPKWRILVTHLRGGLGGGRRSRNSAAAQNSLPAKPDGPNSNVPWPKTSVSLCFLRRPNHSSPVHRSSAVSYTSVIISKGPFLLIIFMCWCLGITLVLLLFISTYIKVLNCIYSFATAAEKKTCADAAKLRQGGVGRN